MMPSTKIDQNRTWPLELKIEIFLNDISLATGQYIIQYAFSNDFSFFSTEAYIVGTQKNRLNETVLLSTQKTCLN